MQLKAVFSWVLKDCIEDKRGHQEALGTPRDLSSPSPTTSDSNSPNLESLIPGSTLNWPLPCFLFKSGKRFLPLLNLMPTLDPHTPRSNLGTLTCHLNNLYVLSLTLTCTAEALPLLDISMNTWSSKPLPTMPQTCQNSVVPFRAAYLSHTPDSDSQVSCDGGPVLAQKTRRS